MISLHNINLYIILDIPLLENLGKNSVDVMEQLFYGGAKIFQLRHKGVFEKELYDEAMPLSATAKKLGAIFIVNDSLSVALAANADGVHLGEDDLPIAAARKIAPKNFIIGASVSSVKSAMNAAQNGADYIGYGAIFQTNTKVDAANGKIDELQKIMQAVKIPVFAIGGINKDNIFNLIEIGCNRVCIASGILTQNNVKYAANEILKYLKDNREE